jgi:hypothetical protein
VRVLCDQEHETAGAYLSSLNREVWTLVATWVNGAVRVPLPDQSLEEWWNSIAGSSQEKGQRDSVSSNLHFLEYLD